MNGPVLIAYATKHGSTREVAEAVAEALNEDGLEVELRPARDVRHFDACDAVVLGGALYMGRWHRDARLLLERYRKAGARIPLAVFAMGPLTLSEADVAGSRRQLEKALAHVPEVKPVASAVFGGVVDPAKLRFPLNRMPASDARDWNAISAWAREIGAALPPSRAVATAVR